MTFSRFRGRGCRIWAVWAIGVAIYLLAIFHRSSLAVAGLAASDRFDISASQLATFTVLQLLVYTLMQIPAGLLVDRYGPRTLLFTGLMVMTFAQMAFALSTTYAGALGARFFVGLGDAVVFISVLRLVQSWFPLHRVPLLNQLTGTIGGLGGIVAAVPMTWALGHLGWTAAYMIAASLGPLLAIALVATMHDAPGRRNARGRAMKPAELAGSLVATWRQPGTKLGFWIHFTTPFSATTLTLLWGYPFFVEGQGRSETTAGSLLTMISVVSLVAGPLLGWYAGRRPYSRSTAALAVIGGLVLTWTLVLAWPGQAPMWALVAMCLVVGVSGPASVMGIDLGRTSNPHERGASVTGLINQGGFIAALAMVLGVGQVLDLLGGSGGGHSPEAFGWAFALQYVLWGLGLVQIVRHRSRLRRHVTVEQVNGGSTMVLAA